MPKNPYSLTKKRQITENGVSAEKSLFTNQKEADTRMFLHVKHAQEIGYRSVVLVFEDTDVFVMAIFASAFIKSVEVRQ